MGPRTSAFFLLLLFLAALAPEAAAAHFELQPGLRVEEEYNDNVFLRSENEYADWVTTIYPSFTAAARTQTKGVEAEYELGYSYYYNANTDFIRHRAGVRAYDQVTPRLNIEAVDTFYRYEDLIEPGLGTLAPRYALRPYIRNTAIPSITYSYGPASDVSLTWTSILLDNEDPAVQDSLGNRVGLELRHALSRHNRLELGYSFEHGSFSYVSTDRFLAVPDFNANRAHGGFVSELSRYFSLLGVYEFEDLQFTNDRVSSYRTHEGRAGFIFAPTPDWTATLTAGYYRLDRDSAGGDTGGLAANVLLQRTFERGVASLAYRRGLAEDYYSGENLGVFRYWQGGAGFTYYLRQHLGAVFEGTVGTRRFQLAARTDEFWSVQTGLIYQLRKWLEAGLRYQLYYLKSTPGPFDFTNNRYTFTLGAQY